MCGNKPETHGYLLCLCICNHVLKNNLSTLTCMYYVGNVFKGSGDDKGLHWNYEAVDDFYKGELKWLPDDALVQSSDKYYEVRAYHIF